MRNFLKVTLLGIFGISLFLGFTGNGSYFIHISIIEKTTAVDYSAEQDYYGYPDTASAETTTTNDITSSDFTFDVNSLSPATKKYTAGSTSNIKEMLANITTTILIVLPTLAVLCIVIGGVMIILAGGKSEGVTKGKTIITYSIVAIFIALFSFSIIKLIIWLLGSTT